MHKPLPGEFLCRINFPIASEDPCYLHGAPGLYAIWESK